MSELSILQDNLYAIHTASKRVQGELVSNFQGTRIYCTSTVWGKLWTHFYSAARYFSNDNLKLTRLQNAIQHTDAIYKRELESVKKNAIVYEKYLFLRLHSNAVDESLYHAARRSLRCWSEATKCFQKPRFLEAERNVCAPYLQPGAPNPSFFEKKDRTLSPYQYLVKLEGKFEGPLPLNLFKKEAIQDKGNQNEFKKLMEWLSRFKKPSQIHKLLATIFKFIEGVDLVSFEIECLKKGHTIFTQSDPKHMCWRQTLQQGTVLDGYTLGKQVGEKIGNLDEHIFFEIQEQPDKLLMVSINRSLLSMKKEWAKRAGWGLKAQEYEYIDPKGRYAIVERFDKKVSDTNWKTKKSLNKLDAKICAPIANYVHWLLKNNLSVTHLSAKNMMFDKNQTLRCVKNQERGSIDFHSLENFLFEVSKQNFLIFKHLIQESRLHDSHFNSFYTVTVNSALHSGVPDISSIAASHGITNKHDIDHATELCELLIKIQNRFLAEYNIQKEALASVMFNIYSKLESKSLLWPTFEDHVSVQLAKRYANLKRF